MSWIPAAVAGIAVIVIFFYPLTRSRMCDIQDALAVKRENDITARPDTQETEESSSNLWKGLPKVMRWVLVILAVILALELMFVLNCFPNVLSNGILISCICQKNNVYLIVGNAVKTEVSLSRSRRRMTP